MLMAGRNISNPNDTLQKVKVEYLYHSIRNPKPEIASMLRLLRTIKDIDSSRYTHVKRQLPYFVCGIFSPPILAMENFAYIEHFVIELNNLAEHDVDTNELKQRLQSDPRVVLAFASPSQNSLKVLFSFCDRCHDIGLFSIFHTIFSRQFMEQYDIEYEVKTVATSVTLTSFISVDENAYYNPDAQPVDIKEFVNTDNPMKLFDAMREARHTAHEQQRSKPTINADTKDKDPSKETVMHIKEVLLGPQSLTKDCKPIIDSSDVDAVVEGIKSFCSDHDLTMTACITLLHARKLRFSMDGQHAEILLYKGAKGYFIVQSPVGNVSRNINRIAAEIINAYLSSQAKAYATS